MSLLLMHRSKMLQMKGKDAIERKFDGSSRFLFLNMGVIRAILNQFGKVSVRKD